MNDTNISHIIKNYNNALQALGEYVERIEAELEIYHRREEETISDEEMQKLIEQTERTI